MVCPEPSTMQQFRVTLLVVEHLCKCGQPNAFCAPSPNQDAEHKHVQTVCIKICEITHKIITVVNHTIVRDNCTHK